MKRSRSGIRLRHSNDAVPGIRRLGTPGAFEYRGRNGRIVTARATLDRIRELAIPPAWTEVWICPDPLGHLQATGRDARGRKQYRYSEAWRALRDADKFDRMLEFARALPAIRRRVRADLATPGLTRRKVLGAIVRLLEDTSFRIGNERYVEQNDSFGLTTLRNRHVVATPGRVELRFRGKGGKAHSAPIDDPQVARVVRRCRELPGQQLFEYVDEAGAVQAIGSSDVNGYLQEIAGIEVTAKDFRTWAGSVCAASTLARMECQVGPTQVNVAVRAAALRLGNTPAICRRSYVHPRVLDPSAWNGPPRRTTRRAGLRAEEARFLALLRPSRAAFPRRPTSTSSPSAAPGR